MFCKQKKKKSLKNVHSPYHQILSIKLCFVTYVIIRHVRLEPNYHYYVFLKHLNFKNKKERARVFFIFTQRTIDTRVRIFFLSFFLFFSPASDELNQLNTDIESRLST